MAQLVNNSPTMQETEVRSLSQEDPWSRKWPPTPLFLPGESHGRRSLVGYSPWGLHIDTGRSLIFFSWARILSGSMNSRTL